MLIDIVGHFEKSLLFVLQWTNDGPITGARIYSVQRSSRRRVTKESIRFSTEYRRRCTDNDDYDDNDNDNNNNDDGENDDNDHINDVGDEILDEIIVRKREKEHE